MSGERGSLVLWASAWLADCGSNSYEGAAEDAEHLMALHERQLLREAAARIRADEPNDPYPGTEYASGHANGREKAADLIDPDVTS